MYFNADVTLIAFSCDVIMLRDVMMSEVCCDVTLECCWDIRSGSNRNGGFTLIEKYSSKFVNYNY